MGHSGKKKIAIPVGNLERGNCSTPSGHFAAPPDRKGWKVGEKSLKGKGLLAVCCSSANLVAH